MLRILDKDKVPVKGLKKYTDLCIESALELDDRSLLADYVSKSQGSNSVLNLSWNFAGATGRLVCSLAGDSHFNNSVKRNGVNYIVRQGYGYVGDSEMPSGATKDTFNTDDNVLFDILAIKSNGKAKIFRIGAGGEARDYEFSF